MEIKTTWEYSEKIEAERLLHCAHQMAVGFYRVNNFIVLPYTPKVKNTLTVTFPDLPYNKIPRFWEKVKKVNILKLPITTPEGLVAKTINLMRSANLPTPEFEKVKSVWAKAQTEIINKIFNIMPSKRNILKEITIYPTAFGTSSSFNWINKKGQIVLYLRQDQKIRTITEAIITSITREEIFRDLSGVWQESEIITDWLVTKSSLAEVLDKYEPQHTFNPTIKGVRIKQAARLMQESNDFYKKLGLPISEKVFGLNGLVPEIYKKPVENLGPTEKKVLRLLIQNAGDIITFDQIADEVFSGEENFSLFAISKLIERLRTKFEANGISGSFIQTLRGRGYLLKN